MKIRLWPLAYSGAAYISFDPGNKTGVVTWDDAGIPMAFHEFDEEELDRFLDLVESYPQPPLRIIIEEYRVYAGVNHTGSKIDTVQVIGNVKRTARRLKIRVIEVRADSKKIAALWAGTKVPKGHMPDWMAAYLVGYWHLHSSGIIPARVLDQK